MAKMDEQFIQDVLNTVDLIPFGRVASYGQIAQIICRPRNARLVGKILGGSMAVGENTPATG